MYCEKIGCFTKPKARGKTFLFPYETAELEKG
jgi:hypothetical protein